jgi:hypothetical protein
MSIVQPYCTLLYILLTSRKSSSFSLPPVASSVLPTGKGGQVHDCRETMHGSSSWGKPRLVLSPAELSEQRGEPQRSYPLSGNPHQVLAPFGYAYFRLTANISRQVRETLLMRALIHPFGVCAKRTA